MQFPHTVRYIAGKRIRLPLQKVQLYNPMHRALSKYSQVSQR